MALRDSSSSALLSAARGAGVAIVATLLACSCAAPAAALTTKERAATTATKRLAAGIRSIPRRSITSPKRLLLLDAAKRSSRAIAAGGSCSAVRTLESLRPRLRSRATYRPRRFPARIADRLDRAAARAARAVIATGNTKRCVIVGRSGKARARTQDRTPTQIAPRTEARDLEQGESQAGPPLRVTIGASRPQAVAATPVATDGAVAKAAGASAARSLGPGARSAAAPAGPFEALTPFGDIGVPRGGAFPQDHQVAEGGGVTMFSGNNDAFVSVDGGRTFSAVNPWTVFGSFEGGFNGDTVLRYAPGIDRFIWLMQGGNDSSNNNNRYVLAVASPAQIRAAVRSGQPVEGVWLIYDLLRSGFGETQTWFDFPHMAIGTGSLYLTWNRVGRGVVNVRIPLSQLPTGRIAWQYWRRDGATFWRIAQQSGPRGVFLRNDDSRDDRAVAHIVENGSTNLVEYGLPHAAIPQRDYSSLTPLGEDWTYRVAGAAIKAATVRRDELWVAWTAARGFANETANRFTQPHVQYAVYRLPLGGQRIPDPLQRISEGNVYNDGVAIVDPSFATSAGGDVALSASFGGPNNAPGPLAGFMTGGDSALFAWFRADATNAGGDRTQGDYSSIAPSYPNSEQLVASGYSTWVEPQGPRVHYGFIRFHRGVAQLRTNTALQLTCPATAVPGSPTTVTGNIAPALSGVQITLEYVLGANTITRSATTDGVGRFAAAAPFGAAGTWTVRASYAGDSTRSASQATCSVAVAALAPNQPQPASLTLTCPSTAFVGDTIAISGALNPALPGASVELRYQPLAGPETVRTLTTDALGRYTDSYLTPTSGNLTIRARFAGNSQLAAADAPPCTFYVQPVPT
ncbi:MAG: hypothetical protein QOE31_1069 [Solirubrobacteraceae bacterium]|nr:hypothetical protein [Solirubrobacteraceae bacterium]